MDTQTAIAILYKEDRMPRFGARISEKSPDPKIQEVFAFLYENFPDRNMSYSEMLFRLENPDSGKCKVCEKPTKFLSFKDGYRDYCSYTCSNTVHNREISEKAKGKTYEELYGDKAEAMRKNRSETHLGTKKSPEAIAKRVASTKITLAKREGISEEYSLKVMPPGKTSKIEDSLADFLSSHGVLFQRQVSVPVQDWPWKTVRSRFPPKVDFYLPETNLYVEVKGFMTMEAMSKMWWLSQQAFPYYVYQESEKDWPVSSEASREELLKGVTSPSGLSRARLREFIERKKLQFLSWTSDDF